MVSTPPGRKDELHPEDAICYARTINEGITVTDPILPHVTIPMFPHDKRIAVTTSWDDGTTFDRPVVEMLNKLNMKGTFNLNSGTLRRTGKPAPDGRGRIDACEVTALYAGHEVAVHTVTHPMPHLVSLTQFAREVIDDRKALEDLVGYPVRGMAYPNGVFNQRIIDLLRSLEIVYARTTQNEPKCFPVEEPLAWPATMHMFGTSPAPLGERWEQCYNNTRFRSAFFVWGHSYEFDRTNRWDDLYTLFTPLANKPDAWYCTNIELWDYHYARQRLVLGANLKTAYNPSAIPVTVKVDDNLIEAHPGVVTQLVTPDRA